MEWVSDEVKDYYSIFNNLFAKLIKHFHPYVELVYVEPKSFNEVFINEKRFNDIDVIICSNFVGDKYYNRSNDRSLGTDISNFTREIQKMLLTDLMNDKQIFAHLIMNKTEHCKGVLKYTID